MASSVARWRRDAPLVSKTEGVRRPLPAAALFPLLLGLVIGSMLLGVGLGAVDIGPEQSVAILLRKTGIDTGIAYSQQQEAVLWAIRLPRVMLAMLVGAGLAASGAALQGIFRNPLADPGLIGVTAGAALGAAVAVVVGFTAFGVLSRPLAAFVSGTAAALVVYSMARQSRQTEVVTLILTGVALNALAGAATGFVVTLADDAELRTITFWQLGSLGGATWRSVGSVAPFAILGLLLLPRWGQALNLFALGEREARYLGVDTERVRLSVIGVCALMTGAAVAMVGSIGFVGLVVPHLVRLAAGPDHRRLLPASALGGAALLVLADLVARTVAVPAELPLGVVTAVAGGPFFLWLLRRTRQEHGGWG